MQLRNVEKLAAIVSVVAILVGAGIGIAPVLAYGSRIDALETKVSDLPAVKQEVDDIWRYFELDKKHHD